jgi:hypothetical protein
MGRLIMRNADYDDNGVLRSWHMADVADELRADHPDYRPDVTALASGDTLSLWSDYLHVSVADGVSVDYSEPLSDDAVRQAIAVLTAYLALKEG